jgi:hypothetical protein
MRCPQPPSKRRRFPAPASAQSPSRPPTTPAGRGPLWSVGAGGAALQKGLTRAGEGAWGNGGGPQVGARKRRRGRRTPKRAYARRRRRLGERRRSAGGRTKAAPWAPHSKKGLRAPEKAPRGRRTSERGRGKAAPWAPHSKKGLRAPEKAPGGTAEVRGWARESGAVGAALQKGKSKGAGLNGTVGAQVIRSETFGIVWDDALQSS